MDNRYTLIYWRDKDWYVGRLKEVPGVFSQGRTLEELEEYIRDAYKMMMEDAETPSGIDVFEKQIGVNS